MLACSYFDLSSSSGVTIVSLLPPLSGELFRRARMRAGPGKGGGLVSRASRSRRDANTVAVRERNLHSRNERGSAFVGYSRRDG